MITRSNSPWPTRPMRSRTSFRRRPPTVVAAACATRPGCTSAASSSFEPTRTVSLLADGSFASSDALPFGIP